MVRGNLTPNPLLGLVAFVHILRWLVLSAFVRGGVGKDVPEDALEPGPVDRGPARNYLLVGLAVRVRLVGTRNRLSLPDRTTRK
ncbi:hypothetical protein SAMN04490220_7440 [Rhodococcus jostii]|uniref:Uncharacterized protein n=1 Tax=Rhodococcus jostii TaxID=132919 RepID=A0A1H5I1S5_RHOJO|nr:hypothetical protein SAMN04490220_7440 [Rhodococcus jostii]